ncbi:hypothetical protein [uncultured Tateyamaria sp.]|uniref:aspartate racemase/maleate isomerase family protein n=1 Tax=uncultured Tateyamaria sp. TaxID=455651 RepID=UPI00260B8C53|nr:hypothetical protein [uncultured Tateyamaria sp.]
MTDRQSNNGPIIGILSPPDWCEPSVDEFRALSATPVRMQQAMVPLPGLEYDDLRNIANAQPQVEVAARLLGNAGACAIGMTGTPFVWAGLSTKADILARKASIAEAAGCEVVMAGTAICDALQALDAQRIAVATPYYTPKWRAQTEIALRAFGFDVAATASADILTAGTSITSIADHDATSDMDTVLRLLTSLRHQVPDSDALVVAGAGVRMLEATPRFEAELGCPVVSSDTALYFSLLSAANLSVQPGLLGSMEAALL